MNLSPSVENFLRNWGSCQFWNLRSSKFWTIVVCLLFVVLGLNVYWSNSFFRSVRILKFFFSLSDILYFDLELLWLYASHLWDPKNMPFDTPLDFDSFTNIFFEFLETLVLRSFVDFSNLQTFFFLIFFFDERLVATRMKLAINT